jgi:hypothetical protein
MLKSRAHYTAAINWLSRTRLAACVMLLQHLHAELTHLTKALQLGNGVCHKRVDTSCLFCGMLLLWLRWEGLYWCARQIEAWCIRRQSSLNIAVTARSTL